MTTKHRILCIEDDEDTCEMLTFALQPSGYEVVSAQTGEDGLSKVLSESFDAILMDTNLPDISGIELCKQIRESDINLPIIFYSGEARPDKIEEAIRQGDSSDYFRRTGTIATKNLCTREQRARNFRFYLFSRS